MQEQKALSLVRDAWAAESLAAAGTARALSQAIRSGVGWSQLSEVVGLSEADARKRWPVER